MLSIALFGTSADPPTAGHQAILVWLANHFDQVAVWASDNPFKSHQTLLIDDIDPPRHNVQVLTELSSPRALITVDRARQRWTDAELTLAIGADLVTQLPRWYHVEELLRQVKLLVMPRAGYAIAPSDLASLRQIGANVTIADVFVPAVSSTAYREEGDPEIVTPPIEEYIHREHLYECQDAPPGNLLTQARLNSQTSK
jgi:nicotinate-nucleotide adenylyltransferase